MGNEFTRALELEMVRAEWDAAFAFAYECARAIWDRVPSRAEAWAQVVSGRGGFT